MCFDILGIRLILKEFSASPTVSKRSGPVPANDRQVGGEHYKSPIQHWDFVEANGIPYMEAQIIKYVMRHAKKGGRKDLEKAQHFLEKLIEVRYPTKLADAKLVATPSVLPKFDQAGY